MEKNEINYFELSSKQKELYNFSHIAKLLADYGYLCTKLSADWNNADFVAQHYRTGNIYKIQLKSRLTIAEKYKGKEIYMAFPYQGRWFIIQHDELLDIIDKTVNYLHSDHWLKKKEYSTDNPAQVLIEKLESYEWKPINIPFVAGQRKSN